MISYDAGMNMVVDTLRLAEEFSDAGFEEKKARVLAEKIGELTSEHFVTKEYLDSKLSELEARLLRFMLAQTAVIVALLKFL